MAKRTMDLARWLAAGQELAAQLAARRRELQAELAEIEQQLSQIPESLESKRKGRRRTGRPAPGPAKGKKLPEYHLGKYEDFEISNFIDGRRSILEIRNAVSAEFRPIPLKDVENYIKVLEIGGRVTLEKRKKHRQISK